MKVLKVLGYVALAIVAIPVVGWLVWGIMAGSESTALHKFCTQFAAGTKVQEFLAAARNADYEVYDQTNLPRDKTSLTSTKRVEAEIAGRLLQRAAKDGRVPSGQTAVIVRKPGIGHYACYIDHNGNAILKTEFVASD